MSRPVRSAGPTTGSARPGGGRLAVVVITRDRRSELLRSLARLTSLPERPQVIVVDNGSRDGTAAAVRRGFPAVSVLALPANGGVAGRNLGVRWAGTDYVAFADDDSWWRPGSLDAAVQIMERDRSVALVAGRVVVGPGGRPDPTSEGMGSGRLGADLELAASGRRAVTGCLACASVVRSRAFLAVGGFPPAFTIGGEEQMVVWDLWAGGWRAVYAPEATAVHFPARGRDPAARRARVVRNDLWACWARLPAVSAATSTAGVLARAGRDAARWRGVVSAVQGAGWALARRAPLPPRVDRARRVLAGD